MDKNEQELIDQLISHLAEVERSSGPRDTQAERYINEAITRRPDLVYYMAQSLIVQEHALKAAQERIEELEGGASQQSSGGGSFLGGMLGGGGSGSKTSVPSGGSVPSAGGRFRYPQADEPMDREPPSRPEPWRGQEPERGGGGGSFLGSVAQTAAGVAGGVVLGNMIGGLFGGRGHSASASPSATQEKPESRADEQQKEAYEAGRDDGFREASDDRDYDDDFDGGDFDGGTDV